MNSFCDHLRDVLWEEIFKLSASAASCEFCEGFRLELMYISLIVNVRTSLTSSTWFSAACAAVMVYRNHSKLKFRQTSDCSKRVFETAKLAYANKTRESITSQKPCSWDFWQIANSVLNKGKSAISPLFNCPEMLASASDKAKLFAKKLF